MDGNKEFFILFIPFLIVFLVGGYLTIITQNLLLKIVFGIITILCFCIDGFALLVQYINWKYYSEKYE